MIDRCVTQIVVAGRRRRCVNDATGKRNGLWPVCDEHKEPEKP